MQQVGQDPIERAAASLGLSTYELFVKAHRAFGHSRRGGISREFREWQRGNGCPLYVAAFSRACLGERS